MGGGAREFGGTRVASGLVPFATYLATRLGIQIGAAPLAEVGAAPESGGSASVRWSRFGPLAPACPPSCPQPSPPSPHLMWRQAVIRDLDARKERGQQAVVNEEELLSMRIRSTSGTTLAEEAVVAERESAAASSFLESIVGEENDSPSEDEAAEAEEEDSEEPWPAVSVEMSSRYKIVAMGPDAIDEWRALWSSEGSERCVESEARWGGPILGERSCFASVTLTPGPKYRDAPQKRNAFPPHLLEQTPPPPR